MMSHMHFKQKITTSRPKTVSKQNEEMIEIFCKTRLQKQCETINTQIKIQTNWLFCLQNCTGVFPMLKMQSTSYGDMMGSEGMGHLRRCIRTWCGGLERLEQWRSRFCPRNSVADIPQPYERFLMCGYKRGRGKNTYANVTHYSLRSEKIVWCQHKTKG